MNRSGVRIFVAAPNIKEIDMRIAFDVHGVLDSLPEYRILMHSLFHDGHMIYIVSGQPLDAEMREFLRTNGLDKCYHRYRSIETYLLERDTPYTHDGKGGKHFEGKYWNHIKAEICKEEDIDMIFDNSVTYAESFKNIRTVFSLVIDKTKSLTRGDQ